MGWSGGGVVGWWSVEGLWCGVVGFSDIRCGGVHGMVQSVVWWSA